MDWFRSYLAGRTQVVSVSGVLSSPLHLDVGVPQGSIPGSLPPPPRFSIYINDLPLLLKDTAKSTYMPMTQRSGRAELIVQIFKILSMIVLIRPTVGLN